MNNYERIEADALWVIEHYGSDAKEKDSPGSKAKAQARRIAEYVRQLDTLNLLRQEHNLDLL